MLIEPAAVSSHRRRIVLLALSLSRPKDPPLPLGHASILAALRDARVDVVSIVRPVGEGGPPVVQVADEVIRSVEGFSHDDVDVAIGVYVWAEQTVRKLLPILRDRGFRGRIILGGPQISYAGEGLERLYSQADVFVRGFAEQAVCLLAQQPGCTPIKGVHYASMPDEREQSQLEMERLPSPWLNGTSSLQGQKFIRQRGCPFACAFCQHRSAAKRPKCRHLEMQRVDAEIDRFCQEGVEEIAVLDPVFNSNPARAIGILERFHRNGYEGKLSLQCRPELVTDAFINAAGNLDVVLELGLQTIHAPEYAAIGRRNELGKVAQALEALCRCSIQREVSLIYGLPEQTLESFIQSVDWCLGQHVPVVKAFPLMLLRGTALERDRAHWRLQESADPIPLVISSSTFAENDHRRMAQLAEALRQSEGCHPPLEELLRRAGGLRPSYWLPAKEAA